MSRFNSWEEVEGFLIVVCVNISERWVVYGTGWCEIDGHLGGDHFSIPEALATVKFFANEDVTNVKVEWIGG